jgi:Tol biopolymer transport system component
MHRHTLIALSIGSMALAAPAAATAAMAYITTPLDSAKQGEVMVANNDGSGARAVASGEFAAISPDGTKVAYHDYGNFSQPRSPKIGVVDVVTGERVLLTGLECGGELIWAPSSQLIACQTQSSNAKGYLSGNGLGLVSVPTSLAGVAALEVRSWIPARGNGVDRSVSFSPDSASIAFAWRRHSQDEGATSVYVAPVASPSARRRVLARAMNPVWGASGIAASRLGRVRRDVTLEGKRYSTVDIVPTQIWTTRPDGTGARRVTSFRWRAQGFTAGLIPTAWSPAGTHIASTVGEISCNAARAGVANIGVSTGRVQLPMRRTSMAPVAYSADGQRILVNDGCRGRRANIRVVNVNGGAPQTLVTDAGGASVSTGWNG